MHVVELAIPDIRVISPVRHGDERGFLSETFKRSALAAAGIALEIVQENHVFSAEQGTLRGLHFQIPPHSHTKLIRVTAGAILDVAVDLRVGSPTFGHHVSATISAEAWNQILIPAGFAHGLVTLEPNTEVVYKQTSEHSPDHDRGIAWDDPTLDIDWGDSSALVISERDRNQPMLAEIPTYFTYERDR